MKIKTISEPFDLYSCPECRSEEHFDSQKGHCYNCGYDYYWPDDPPEKEPSD